MSLLPITTRLALLSTLLAASAHAADPLDDLEAQYQTATAVLKKPPVTGILITEVAPESAAAAEGLRAGDILVEYYGTRVTTLKALSQQVAEAVARRIEDDTSGKRAIARVRRGTDEKIFSLPRDILGIRAVEVEAGVPGPRNPPPNPRGTLNLDWNALLQTLQADRQRGAADGANPNSQGTQAFRLLSHSDPQPDPARPGHVFPADEDWIGWELCSLTPETNAIAGTLDLYHLMPTSAPPDDNQIPTEHSRFTFHLHLGDYKSAPAFVLDDTSARYAAAAGQENMQFVTTAKRLGEKLQVSSGLAPLEAAIAGRTEHHDNAAPLNASPQCALPWIAAALPHEADAALALYLLSTRDLIPRPGYVLATRGRSPLPVDPLGADPTPPAAATAPSPPLSQPEAPLPPWRVDLVHFGIIIESYWFTDQHRLLCLQTQGPQSIVARLAQDPKSASTPQDKKPPATAPTTNP